MPESREYHKEGILKQLIYTFHLPLLASILLLGHVNAQDSTGISFDQSTQYELFSGEASLDVLGNTEQMDDSIFPVFQSLSARTAPVMGISGQASVTTRSANDVMNFSNFSSLDGYDNATQFQARANYTNEFNNGNGNVNLWLGALWQERQIRSLTQGVNSRDDSFGYNLGVDFKYAAINLMGTYYDGEAIDILYFNPRVSNASCFTPACDENSQEGYLLRGAYQITQATSLGITYSESSMQLQSGIGDGSDSELWSIGLYHDVNSWLKLIAEYNEISTSNYSFDDDHSSISVGGSISW
jgi:predicted porin